MNTNVTSDTQYDYNNWLELLDQACNPPYHYVSLNSSKKGKTYTLSSTKDSQRLSIDQIIKISREYISKNSDLPNLVVLKHFYMEIDKKTLSNSFWTKVIHFFRGMGFVGTQDLIKREINSITNKIESVSGPFNIARRECLINGQPINMKESEVNMWFYESLYQEPEFKDKAHQSMQMYGSILLAWRTQTLQFDRIPLQNLKSYEIARSVLKINSCLSAFLSYITYSNISSSTLKDQQISLPSDPKVFSKVQPQEICKGYFSKRDTIAEELTNLKEKLQTSDPSYEIDISDLLNLLT
jgi:hypothetical protein